MSSRNQAELQKERVKKGSLHWRTARTRQIQGHIVARWAAESPLEPQTFRWCRVVHRDGSRRVLAEPTVRVRIVVVLRFSSCQAPIAEPFCAALASAIGAKLGIGSEFVGGISWQERDRLLDRGEIHVCWICGLPYVRKRDNGQQHAVELVAAPVGSHVRYGDQPIYYSDVLVHAESGLRTFAQLRGRTWAYNEPGSHSGHNITRYQLAVEGFGPTFFGRIVQSGSHQESLQLLLD